jgi:hypothetical protein
MADEKETTREQTPAYQRPEIDRTVIRRLLALSPAERFRLAVEEARNVERLDRRIRR